MLLLAFRKVGKLEFDKVRGWGIGIRKRRKKTFKGWFFLDSFLIGNLVHNTMGPFLTDYGFKSFN